MSIVQISRRITHPRNEENDALTAESKTNNLSQHVQVAEVSPVQTQVDLSLRESGPTDDDEKVPQGLASDEEKLQQGLESDDENVQQGVKDIEATTSAWNKRWIIVAYIMIVRLAVPIDFHPLTSFPVDHLLCG